MGFRTNCHPVFFPSSFKKAALCSAFGMFLFAAHGQAQISFSTAVKEAVANSPKVRAAQGDVAKAESGLAVMRDIYIPSVVVGGGAGTAYGITLSVPTIFTVNAQSLVFSFQQRSYIRAAHMDVTAARLALTEAQDEVREDAAITYLSVNHAQLTVAALKQQFGYATRLASIVQDRVRAHLDSDLDLKKARRDALGIRLQEMQAEDDLASQRAHLADLTGLAAGQLVALPESIPDFPDPASVVEPGQAMPDNPGLLSAEAALQARDLRARGDAQYSWKPNISFGAQYGRISPIENVSEFYNIKGNYNSAAIGVQVQFPLLDRVRTAAAKQSALDAARAELDLDNLKQQQAQGRQKLARGAEEAAVHAQIADLNYGIAQDELQSVLIQEHTLTGGAPLTPKEEVGARMEERQKYLDLLDARLDAQKAAVLYLRQAGQLESWLVSLANGPSAPPEGQQPSPSPQ